MDVTTDRDSKAASFEAKVHSLWLVAGMAIAGGSLRFALWASNVITLWYLYGWATVRHDHLTIVRVKPDLVVSNGDVLHGIGGYHYFVGVVVWLPLTIGLAFLVDRVILPEACRRILKENKPSKDSCGAWALLYVLPMLILVTAFLPTLVALFLALASAVVPIIWLRTICRKGSIG